MKALAEVLSEHAQYGGWSNGQGGWLCACGLNVDLPPEHAAHLADLVVAWLREVALDQVHATEACDRSLEHSAGRGRHNAFKFGPCSDHERIGAECQQEMEPFVELLNATIEQQSGVKGYIRFGRKPNGDPDLVVDTNEGATAVALAYLEGER